MVSAYTLPGILSGLLNSLLPFQRGKHIQADFEYLLLTSIFIFGLDMTKAL